MTDIDYLVCSAIRTSPTPWIAGTKIYFCKNCSTEIWVSPASEKVMKEKELAPICTHCAADLAKEMPEIEIAPPTADQIKEIKDAS